MNCLPFATAGPSGRSVARRGAHIPTSAVKNSTNNPPTSSGGGRQPWDIGRFVKTAVFFNGIPTPADVLRGVITQPIKLAQGIMARDTESRKSAVLTMLGTSGTGVQLRAAEQAQRDVVMVVGVANALGARVVEKLLDDGKKVRLLVASAQTAEAALRSSVAVRHAQLEVAVADVSQRSTLTSDLFEGVSSVVIIGGADMDAAATQNLLEAVKPRVGLRDGEVLMAPGDASLPAWGALDDVVMGGCSESVFAVERHGGENGEAAAVFRGYVSTDNNGGFASVRTRNFEPCLDLSAYDGIELRLKGNGLRYKCIIRSDTFWDSVSYCKSFDTEKDEWQTVRLPFREFIPVMRARMLREHEPLNTAHVASVQLMLSKFEYDGNLNPHFATGPFALPVSNIKAYLGEQAPARCVLLSTEASGSAQRIEDMVRGSGMPSAVVRLPQGAQTTDDDAASLCVDALRQPRA